MSESDIELNHLVAEQLFGWKWISWVSRPTRSHPNYPVECRCRRFFSPELLADGTQWKEYLANHDSQEADGEEPLDYSYCSANGPEMVPDYFGRDDILVLQHVRADWPRKRVEAFTGALAMMWGERGKPAHTSWMAWALYEPGDYSRAALIVLGNDTNED